LEREYEACAVRCQRQPLRRFGGRCPPRSTPSARRT